MNGTKQQQALWSKNEIKISASMGVRRNFSREETSKFCLSLTGCWRYNANGRSHNALFFYTISLCWSNLNSQSFVWNVFCTSAMRNAFSFHKLPNIHFCERFLQISHILRQRPEHERWKPRKLDTLAKVFQAMWSRTICWQSYRTTYKS